MIVCGIEGIENDINHSDPDSLSPSPTTVAVLAWENPMKRVREDVGHIQVCSTVQSPAINCPLNFPLDLNILTISDTAGMCVKKIVTETVF